MANQNSYDDEFGGFEEAPAIETKKNNDLIGILTPNSNQNTIPDWLVKQTFNKSIESANSTVNQPTSNSTNLSIKSLQEELIKLKEQLIDQQTFYLEMQTKYRHDVEEKNSFINKYISKLDNEFQSTLNKHLAQQRETSMKDFKNLLDIQKKEQETQLKDKIKEYFMQYERKIDEKIEDKLVDLQEKIFIQQQSDMEDLEVKIGKIIINNIKEEQLIEKANLKHNLEQIQREIKAETEKYVQNFFKNQNEFFKEQIKSGIQQEHLIHKDLINNKLENLFKASEEKRRHSNFLFNRHLGGLNFFIENAQKQLSLFHQAHNEMLKNKETVDYFGNIKTSEITNNNDKDSILNSLASMSLFGSTKQQTNSQLNSKQISDASKFNTNLIQDDKKDLLMDENLLDDLF